MKKIELTEKQKHFLKKVGIAAGAIAVAGRAFYIFNRSDTGCKFKHFLVSSLHKSIILKNDRSFTVHATGLKSEYTEDDIQRAADAAINAVLPERA